jgi:hypothetical protein
LFRSTSSTIDGSQPHNDDNLILGHGFTFKGNVAKMQRTTKILGYTLHHTLNRGLAHRTEILAKARKAEGKIAAMHIYGGDKIRIEAALGYYTGLVQSVITTGLINSQLDDENYDKPRIIQASVIKNCTGMGSRVPAWIALLEFGWTPIDAAIAAAKMKFHDRMMRRPQEGYVKHMIEARNLDTLEGETEGIAAEVQALWDEAGLRAEHGNWPKKSTQARSELIKTASELIAHERACDWLEENGSQYGHYDVLYEGQRAPHTHNGTKRQIALMCTARAGALNLRGSRTAAEGRDKTCTLCSVAGVEDETQCHVLIKCDAYNSPRETLQTALRQTWTASSIRWTLELGALLGLRRRRSARM